MNMMTRVKIYFLPESRDVTGLKVRFEFQNPRSSQTIGPGWMRWSDFVEDSNGNPFSCQVNWETWIGWTTNRTRKEHRTVIGRPERTGFGLTDTVWLALTVEKSLNCTQVLFTFVTKYHWRSHWRPPPPLFWLGPVAGFAQTRWEFWGNGGM